MLVQSVCGLAPKSRAGSAGSGQQRSGKQGRAGRREQQTRKCEQEQEGIGMSPTAGCRAAERGHSHETQTTRAVGAGHQCCGYLAPVRELLKPEYSLK